MQRRPQIIGEDKRVQFFYDVGKSHDMMCACFPQSQMQQIILGAQKQMIDNAINEARLNIMSLLGNPPPTPENEDEITKVTDITRAKMQLNVLQNALLQTPPAEAFALKQQIQQLQATLRDQEFDYQFSQNVLKSDQTLAHKVQEHMKQLTMLSEREAKYQKCLEDAHELQGQVNQKTFELHQKIDEIQQLNSEKTNTSQKVQLEAQQKLQQIQKLQTDLEEIQKKYNESLQTVEWQNNKYNLMVTELKQTQSLLTEEQKKAFQCAQDNDKYFKQFQDIQKQINLANENYNKLVQTNQQLQYQIASYQTQEEGYQQHQQVVNDNLAKSNTIRTLEADNYTLQQQLQTIHDNYAKQIKGITEERDRYKGLLDKEVSRDKGWFFTSLQQVVNNCLLIDADKCRLYLCAYLNNYLNYKDIKPFVEYFFNLPKEEFYALDAETTDRHTYMQQKLATVPTVFQVLQSIQDKNEKFRVYLNGFIQKFFTYEQFRPIFLDFYPETPQTELDELYKSDPAGMKLHMEQLLATIPTPQQTAYQNNKESIKQLITNCIADDKAKLRLYLCAAFKNVLAVDDILAIVREYNNVTKSAKQQQIISEFLNTYDTDPPQDTQYIKSGMQLLLNQL